jgi:peptidoglycan/LPS O-acetylase OafA/YrhL
MKRPLSFLSNAPILRPQMPELDTLRGIAVSMVVLFHGLGFTYGLAGLSGIPKFLVALTLPGWTGVNLFFVLSGFLITGILLDTRPRPDYYRRFYYRRALRILPLYYVTLLLLLVLARTGIVPRHASWSFLGLSAIYLANVSDLLGVPTQYGVLWSLAVEEHFYLLWPAAVRNLSRQRVIICAVLTAGSCLLLRSLYWAFHYSGGGYTWLCADGLAMGAILAAVVRNTGEARTMMRRATTLAFASSFGLVVVGTPFGILMARNFLGVTFRETAIDLFFTGVLGLTLLLGTSRWQGLVNLRPFQFLGRISYGIYLTHMLMFESVGHVTARYWPAMQGASGRFNYMVIQFCLSGSLTIAVTWISRWYFEEPFLRLKDRVDQSPILQEDDSLSQSRIPQLAV